MPMRDFLQERAMHKLAGREVAKSLLHFGCHSPSEDFIYAVTVRDLWLPKRHSHNDEAPKLQPIFEYLIPMPQVLMFEGLFFSMSLCSDT